METSQSGFCIVVLRSLTTLSLFGQNSTLGKHLYKSEKIIIFNLMVEYNKLSLILKAVSDVTRRSILTLLCQQGPRKVTELAGHYRMSLNAVSKHIKILESTGLVRRTTIGRVHLIEADLKDFQLVEQWFNEMESIWRIRLNALANLIETETGEPTDEK
jgi:DNA-binding transcriptional ArsR family regulator